MEKKLKSFGVNYRLEWAYDDIPIQQIRKDLDEIENLGATHISFELCHSYNDESWIEFNPLIKRLETDIEYHERLKLEEKWKQSIIDRELEQLKTLKEKHER